jgi:hypothetical protein
VHGVRRDRAGEESGDLVMPWHVVIRLPDGAVACADYREPAAARGGPMRKVNEALAQGRAPDPALYEAVAVWLAAHREQSAACHAGLSPAGLPCGHD